MEPAGRGAAGQRPALPGCAPCTFPAISAPRGDRRGREVHALGERLQRTQLLGIAGIQRDLRVAVLVELHHGDAARFVTRRLLAAQVGLVPVQRFTGEQALFLAQRAAQRQVRVACGQHQAEHLAAIAGAGLAQDEVGPRLLLPLQAAVGGQGRAHVRGLGRDGRSGQQQAQAHGSAQDVHGFPQRSKWPRVVLAEGVRGPQTTQAVRAHFSPCASRSTSPAR
ncbi:transposase [Stenotrophomonas rhizophila]|uniref:transposase n=1 Tax=Stenotrophomonas rhizophila TaxID=216778 RepID=UPI003D12EDDB